MKKLLFIMLFLATLAGSTNAQNNTNTKLKRTLLFTLGANEKIVPENFSFLLDSSGIKYYCLTESDKYNNSKYENQLIINGTIVETARLIKIYSENVFNKDEFIYTYFTKAQDEDSRYEGFLKYNNKTYGPYQDVAFEDSPVECIFFKQMEKYFVLLLPDERIIGPIQGANSAEKIDVAYYLNGVSIITAFQREPWGTTVYYNGEYLYKNNNVIEQFYNVISNKKGDCFFIETHTKGETYFNGSSIGETSSYYKLTDDGMYIYCYYNKDEKKVYLNINGNAFGGFDQVKNYDINNKGDYIYRYVKDDKDYVNVNGKTVGIHDNIDDYIEEFVDGVTAILGGNNLGGASCAYGFDAPIINDKGEYIYAYRTNGQYYISINGHSKGPYEGTWRPYIDNKGNYIYPCKSGNKFYIVYNDKKDLLEDVDASLGLELVFPDYYMTRNGHYIYHYNKNGKSYVNVEGQIHGPYDKTWGCNNIDENGVYGYCYSKDGKDYICENGKHYLLEQTKQNSKNILKKIQTDSKTFISEDKKNMMLCSSKYSYVLINNQKYGNGKILEATYDSKLNAFYWISVEGKELVVYEYKMD
ncbi:MAG: hypothetical protein LBG80_17115 [Bacteroidales bacterium]|jgi:hypothetical protein|nr:hypothetical protein [Bacteroidales bacterium]